MKIIESWEKYMKSRRADKEFMAIPGNAEKLSKSINRSKLTDKDWESGKNSYNKYYPNDTGISDKYKNHILDILDDGWEYTIAPQNQGMDIFKAGGMFMELWFYKWFDKDGFSLVDGRHVEEEFPDMIRKFKQAEDRFLTEYDHCNFIVDFKGVGQQDLNPKTHKRDDYKYKGFGEPTGRWRAKIRLMII